MQQKHSVVEVADFWYNFLDEKFPLCLLTDLDGTLIPFARNLSEANPPPVLLDLLIKLAQLPNTMISVVSGRPRDNLETHFGAFKNIRLVAEHGTWCCDQGVWRSMLEITPKNNSQELAARLNVLASCFTGAYVEQKTFSVALHYRQVKTSDRAALVVAATAATDSWLKEHKHFERLLGEQVIELRPRCARKSGSVKWVREQLGFEGRCLAMGDDLTDEDMFRALHPEDAAIIVGNHTNRPTAAGWQLNSTEETLAFCQMIYAIRSRSKLPQAKIWPLPHVERQDPSTAYNLLVISNRLPELRHAASDHDARKQPVGGLVSALEPIMSEHHGIWLGWNGQQQHDAALRLEVNHSSSPALAWVSLTADWYQDYYKGFCNSTLWPLLHSFSSRARFQLKEWQAYCQVNEAFIEKTPDLVSKDAMIWVHDYHLLLAGHYLRKLGHVGPTGLFLHVPFPGPDIFYLLPWAETILKAMLDFDVLGFHTHDYAENFRQCIARLPDSVRSSFNNRMKKTQIGVFPLGVIPENFQETPDTATTAEIENLRTTLQGQRLVLGIDRLDYTKGIPERILAFGELLRRYPSWRRRVALVQISVPSRADIIEYEEQRSHIEEIVGRINGEYGEADWMPIRYLYRSYDRQHLQEFYRLAEVGYVTPLRDGMNLVAKEFVAAQNPDKPGVLLLSKFAGAAAELSDAVLTNPWDMEGMAEDLNYALSLSQNERVHRHQRLLACVMQTTARSWAGDFLAALTSSNKTNTK